MYISFVIYFYFIYNMSTTFKKVQNQNTFNIHLDQFKCLFLIFCFLEGKLYSGFQSTKQYTFIYFLFVKCFWYEIFFNIILCLISTFEIDIFFSTAINQNDLTLTHSVSTALFKSVEQNISVQCDISIKERKVCHSLCVTSLWIPNPVFAVCRAP